jgi:copper chaperone CopZ
MYADHHVVEVRRILLQIPGVTAVYASSAFGQVEIDFDADGTTADAFVRRLAEAGYLSDLPTPMESGEAARDGAAAGGQYRRLSTSRAAAGAAIAFRRELAAGTPPASTGERSADANDE